MTTPVAPPAPAPAKQSNWFARHKVLTGLGAFVIVASIATAASGGQTAKQQDSSTKSSSSNTAKTDDTKKTTTKATKTETKAEDGLQADGKTWIFGDWKITNLKVSNTDSMLNMFKVTSDLTYAGDDNSGGDKCFNLTLDKGNRQVASGMGCANSVLPGKTATLDFATMDDFVKGPYDITISKTW